MRKYPYLISVLLCCIHATSTSDMTYMAFGHQTTILPAAFGDFNSDELTDLFVIEQNFRNVTIFLASPKEPFFQKSERLFCELPPDYKATSVIPGDFDGDGFMDFLVTAVNLVNNSNGMTYVFVNWGHVDSVNCSKSKAFTMVDEPLVVDYNQDLIADLFGRKNETTNLFWIFSTNRSEPPQEVPLIMPEANISMRLPHSHAFVDMNDDNLPDLFLTTDEGFATWSYNKTSNNFIFDPEHRIPYPKPKDQSYLIGQNLFMDLETAGKLQVIVPVCKREGCTESAIYVYANDRWVNLNVSFNNSDNKTWNFIGPKGQAYTDTITLRAADFNNDGYVDLLATLTKTGTSLTRTFLLENVACEGGCSLQRTFRVRWDALGTYQSSENSVMGTFYDFLQDGIMDVIFVHPVSGYDYRVSAFKNGLDYDANFLKVMVISGRPSAESAAHAATSVLAPKSTFGTSLPGPKIRYQTTNQEGQLQLGMAVQLPQSAHFALYLPYTIFGLGRTPNFIDELVIGTFNNTHTWTQIIPNSQMVVIPYPRSEPDRWKAQLFVTPSKIVLQTVFALLGTCLLISVVIAVLHWKERREDRIEKLQEAHRFHFDAM